MGQSLVDCRYEALVSQGFSPAHVNDMLKEWLIANGALVADGDSLPDLWMSMLISQLGSEEVPQHRNDMWFHLLGLLGYEQATLIDREYQFWCDGGNLRPPIPPPIDYGEICGQLPAHAWNEQSWNLQKYPIEWDDLQPQLNGAAPNNPKTIINPTGGSSGRFYVVEEWEEGEKPFATISTDPADHAGGSGIIHSSLKLGQSVGSLVTTPQVINFTFRQSGIVDDPANGVDGKFIVMGSDGQNGDDRLLEYTVTNEFIAQDSGLQTGLRFYLGPVADYADLDPDAYTTLLCPVAFPEDTPDGPGGYRHTLTMSFWPEMDDASGILTITLKMQADTLPAVMTTFELTDDNFPGQGLDKGWWFTDYLGNWPLAGGKGLYGALETEMCDLSMYGSLNGSPLVCSTMRAFDREVEANHKIIADKWDTDTWATQIALYDQTSWRLDAFGEPKYYPSFVNRNSTSSSNYHMWNNALLPVPDDGRTFRTFMSVSGVHLPATNPATIILTEQATKANTIIVIQLTDNWSWIASDSKGTKITLNLTIGVVPVSFVLETTVPLQNKVDPIEAHTAAAEFLAQDLADQVSALEYENIIIIDTTEGYIGIASQDSVNYPLTLVSNTIASILSTGTQQSFSPVLVNGLRAYQSDTVKQDPKVCNLQIPDFNDYLRWDQKLPIVVHFVARLDEMNHGADPNESILNCTILDGLKDHNDAERLQIRTIGGNPAPDQMTSAWFGGSDCPNNGHRPVPGNPGMGTAGDYKTTVHTIWIQPSSPSDDRDHVYYMQNGTQMYEQANISGALDAGLSDDITFRMLGGVHSTSEFDLAPKSLTYCEFQVYTGHHQQNAFAQQTIAKSAQFLAQKWAVEIDPFFSRPQFSNQFG